MSRLIDAWLILTGARRVDPYWPAKETETTGPVRYKLIFGPGGETIAAWKKP